MIGWLVDWLIVDWLVDWYGTRTSRSSCYRDCDCDVTDPAATWTPNIASCSRRHPQPTGRPSEACRPSTTTTTTRTPGPGERPTTKDTMTETRWGDDADESGETTLPTTRLSQYHRHWQSTYIHTHSLHLSNWLLQLTVLPHFPLSHSVLVVPVDFGNFKY